MRAALLLTALERRACPVLGIIYLMMPFFVYHYINGISFLAYEACFGHHLEETAERTPTYVPHLCAPLARGTNKSTKATPRRPRRWALDGTN